MAQLFPKKFFTDLNAMFVDNSLRFLARDFRADFLKLAPSHHFETSSRSVKNYKELPHKEYTFKPTQAVSALSLSFAFD